MPAIYSGNPKVDKLHEIAHTIGVGGQQAGKFIAGLGKQYGQSVMSLLGLQPAGGDTRTDPTVPQGHSLTPSLADVGNAAVVSLPFQIAGALGGLARAGSQAATATSATADAARPGAVTAAERLTNNGGNLQSLADMASKLPANNPYKDSLLRLAQKVNASDFAQPSSLFPTLGKAVYNQAGMPVAKLSNQEAANVFSKYLATQPEDINFINSPDVAAKYLKAILGGGR